MFVVVALAVDAGYLLLGSWASDMACRDAARAAAQRATLSEARKAARAAIRSYQTAVVSPTITDNDVEQVMPTIGGQPDTSKCPYVKVTATANVHLPIPLSVGKVGFPATIAVARSYVFPIMESPTGS
jgi:Flp pilus assembly protein TadG